MRNLSLATVFAAASGFVVMWIASWALDAELGYGYFLAFWGLFFAATGLIDGITQETTRAVAASRETKVRGTANPWKLGAAIGAALAVVVLAAGVAGMSRIVPSNPGTGDEDPWMDYVENLLTPERFPRLSRLFVAAKPTTGTLTSELQSLLALRDTGAITPEQFDELVRKLGS